MLRVASFGLAGRGSVAPMVRAACGASAAFATAQRAEKLSFDKVLIANRGEIACRINRTCKELGLSTVAVYSEVDANTKHVKLADERVLLGAAPPTESYTNIERIVDACKMTGAGAVHPGYGFLSENAEFARALEDNGIVFVGPRADTIVLMGAKHTARAAAEEVGLPVVPGTDLLATVDEAVEAAENMGYPVLLKAVGGGGGIGLHRCENADDIRAAFDVAQEQGQAYFGDSRVILEKYLNNPKHVEIQVFGDGKGNAVHFWDRECSIQRRHQKIVEEAPAVGLLEATRKRLNMCAVELAKHVKYRGAGTVEFLVEPAEEDAVGVQPFYFLEMNTRLQVEHGISELISGVDIVALQLKVAGEDDVNLKRFKIPALGHAIEARVCAEDPTLGFAGSSGVVTKASFWEHPAVRTDTFLEDGTPVTSHYDSLIAKIMVHTSTREGATKLLIRALQRCQIEGVTTNIPYLISILNSQIFREGKVNTSFLQHVKIPTMEVFDAGFQTHVQDYPGRIGHWKVGIPPSGSYDNLSHRIANTIVGNMDNAATLEMTFPAGPVVKFNTDVTISIVGTKVNATLDGEDIPLFEAVDVPAGAELNLESFASDQGCRAYLAVRGGFSVSKYMNSSSTFLFGKFGGLRGRALVPGDMLMVGRDCLDDKWNGAENQRVNKDVLRELYGVEGQEVVLPEKWDVGVIPGPHSSPDFFTPDFEERFYEEHWKVSHNSNRMGIRLIGPKPEFSRKDGGEGGAHPSNLHDCVYAVGTINFTGDMPIILGVDGPSLGGFVSLCTITTKELWKVGQFRPGHRVQFRPRTVEAAVKELQQQLRLLDNLVSN